MTIIKSGELASFYTVNKTPIKHLRVYFSPKQAGTGDPSPENIREISGWDGIEITHCGKNLYNPANVIMNQELYPAGDLYPTGATNRWCVSDYMPVKPNTTYIATALLTKGGGRYALYDENKNYLRGAQEKVGADAQTIITTNADARYVRLTIRIGDQLNTVFEENVQENVCTYYPGQFHTLDWSNDIGTVYGGYVDLVTGELVQEWYNAEPSKWTKYKESNGYYAYRLDGVLPAEKYSPTAGIQKISNMISEYGSFNSSNMNKNIIQYYNYVALQQDIDIMNLQYMYKLAEPITHQLTPTQLQTLLGRNNIWSNADRVEVEYDLAESNDELYRRRNILLRSAPHIETVSGSLAHFETDMIAPLKECKIHFSPVQEGTGDPSPDNVKAITGWSGCNVQRTGKNLFDVSKVAGKNISVTNNIITINSTSGSGVLSNKIFSEIVSGLKVGETYTLSFDKTGTVENYIWLRAGNGGGGLWRNGETRTLSEDDLIYAFKMYGVGTISNFQIEHSSIISNYSSFITPNVLSLNWTTEAGTAYGGYVDLINGKVVAEWQMITITDKNPPYVGASSYDGTIASNRYFGISKSTGIRWPSMVVGVCDKAKIVKASIWTDPNNYIGYFTVNAYKQIHIVFDHNMVGIISEDSSSERTQKISNWLADNPITLVVPLADPVIYTVDPLILKTFHGTNNIWSNANGPVEIKYWTH